MGIYYDNDICGFAIESRDDGKTVYKLEFKTTSKAIAREIMANMSKYDYMIHYICVCTTCSDTYGVSETHGSTITSYLSWRVVNLIELREILTPFLDDEIDNALLISMSTLTDSNR